MYSNKIRPYNGDEPYIFISYAHKDNSIVLPIVERMTQDGYRILYDEGITPGTEWDDEIALHIDNFPYSLVPFLTCPIKVKNNISGKLYHYYYQKNRRN